MKKLLSLLLVLLMSLSMMAVLSSCDDLWAGIIPSDEEEAGEDNKNDEQTGDKNDNTEEVPEVITTVTEAEWNALDEIVNFTYSVTSKIEFKVSGNVTTSQSSSSVKMTSTSVMEKNGDVARYMVLEDDVWYSIEKDGDAYYKTKLDTVPYGNSLLELMESFCESYSSLTYDAEKKAYAYTADTGMMGSEADYLIYFENGLPVKIECKSSSESDGESYSAEIDVAITDVNKTTVTLPEYTEIRTTLTEDEWLAFANLENLTVNMEYYVTVIIPGMDDYVTELYGWMAQTSDARVVYNPMTETETIYLLIDGEEYELYLDEDGNYLATPSADSENPADFYPESINDFTYDNDDGLYHYAFTDGNGSENEITIKAENGKVVEMVLYMESESDGFSSMASVTMTFEEIGTTEIEIPPYAVVEEAEVSEELWNSLREIYNYTLTVSGEYAEFDSNGNEMTQDLSALEMQNEEIKYKGDLEGNGLVWVLVEGAWYEAYSDDPDNFVESTDPLVSMGDMLVFDGEYISFESLVYNSDTDGYDLDYTVNLWGVDCEASFYFIDGIPYMVEFFGISTEMDGDVEVTRAVDMTYLFTDVGTTTFE